MKALEAALLELGSQARSGGLTADGAAVATKIGWYLQVDLAAASNWSPTLIGRALIARPEAAHVAIELLGDRALGDFVERTAGLRRGR